MVTARARKRYNLSTTPPLPRGKRLSQDKES